MIAEFRPPASKESARLRLYLVGLVLDMWAMLAAFILANWLVLGSPWGEPGKPHGLVMAAMIALPLAMAAITLFLPARAGAVTGLVACAVDNVKLDDAVRTAPMEQYYPSTLRLLALAAAAARYPQCL